MELMRGKSIFCVGGGFCNKKRARRAADNERDLYEIIEVNEVNVNEVDNVNKVDVIYLIDLINLFDLIYLFDLIDHIDRIVLIDLIHFIDIIDLINEFYGPH